MISLAILQTMSGGTAQMMEASSWSHTFGETLYLNVSYRDYR